MQVLDLQNELTKTASNLLKLEEEKDQLQSTIKTLNNQLDSSKFTYTSELTRLTDEINDARSKFDDTKRQLEVKTNEHELLKENINGGSEMVDFASLKAELLQLGVDKRELIERLQRETSKRSEFEKEAQAQGLETQVLKVKYDEADRERVETQTKLEVLSSYFTEREAQLQK